ncbi:hypothetical protein FQA39_LY18587 [Lamprigera yunnana]|nr:hypothetical protein FQA39_LY18587 [Lamprigera yunnana]
MGFFFKTKDHRYVNFAERGRTRSQQSGLRFGELSGRILSDVAAKGIEAGARVCKLNFYLQAAQDPKEDSTKEFTCDGEFEDFIISRNQASAWKINGRIPHLPNEANGGVLKIGPLPSENPVHGAVKGQKKHYVNYNDNLGIKTKKPEAPLDIQGKDIIDIEFLLLECRHQGYETMWRQAGYNLFHSEMDSKYRRLKLGGEVRLNQHTIIKLKSGEGMKWRDQHYLMLLTMRRASLEAEQKKSLEKVKDTSWVSLNMRSCRRSSSAGYPGIYPIDFRSHIHFTSRIIYPSLHFPARPIAASMQAGLEIDPKNKEHLIQLNDPVLVMNIKISLVSASCHMKFYPSEDEIFVKVENINA